MSAVQQILCNKSSRNEDYKHDNYVNNSRLVSQNKEKKNIPYLHGLSFSGLSLNKL